MIVTNLLSVPQLVLVWMWVWVYVKHIHALYRTMIYWTRLIPALVFNRYVPIGSELFFFLSLSLSLSLSFSLYLHIHSFSLILACSSLSAYALFKPWLSLYSLYIQLPLFMEFNEYYCSKQWRILFLPTITMDDFIPEIRISVNQSVSCAALTSLPLSHLLISSFPCILSYAFILLNHFEWYSYCIEQWTNIQTRMRQQQKVHIYLASYKQRRPAKVYEREREGRKGQRMFVR